MKIISNIKDYYDGLQSFEDPIVYNRIFEVADNRKLLNTNFDREIYQNLNFSPDIKSDIKNSLGFTGIENLLPVIFGFCGNYYPMYFSFTSAYMNNDSEFLNARLTIELESSYKNGNIYLASKYDGSEFYENFGVLKKRHIKYLGNNFNFIYKENLFHKYNSPILLISTFNIRKNGEYLKVWKNFPLTKVNWQKVQGINGVFQTLEMFIGGVLNSVEKPIVHLDSKFRMESRFGKWSFRKMPTKKNSDS